MTNPAPEQPKVVAVVQARMGSTRLPGKLFLPLGPKTVLRWVLDRVREARRVDDVVVATSTAAENDRLVERCGQWGVGSFRGSESDVLGRCLAAAREADAGWVVRVNADNPLVDPRYIDALVDAARQGRADYQSYRRGDSKPVMLTALSFFAEVISRECLERADREIRDRFEREHVTLGIYGRPSRFDVRWLDVPAWCNDPRLRLTVDTQADLDLLRQVVAGLGPGAETATAEQVVRLVQEHSKWLETMAVLNAANPKTEKSR